MAGESRNLTVSLSRAALLALDEIWDWNARRYGDDHAHRYVAYLRAETHKLATAYFKGSVVPTAPRLSYIILRRKRKQHGHVVVYELIDDVIQVLQYYHTAQDWQMKLSEQNT